MITSRLVATKSKGSLRRSFSNSVKAEVRQMMSQASSKYDVVTGVSQAGKMMHHLVGVVLELNQERGAIVHLPICCLTDQRTRPADFLIGDAAIHVTNNPTEALIHKCQRNLEGRLRPIIITSQRGAIAIDQLAENQGISDRIDIFEFEQFIALNLYELGRFANAGNRVAISEIVIRYNQIVGEVETDPSLCIEQ